MFIAWRPSLRSLYNLAYNYCPLHSLMTGCKLVIWDLNEDGLEAVGKEIRSIGGTVYCYKCNLCDKNEIHETAKKVKEEVGEISLLINNAGIVTGRKFMDCTDEAIVATFDVNSMSHFWVSQDCKKFFSNHLHNTITLSSCSGFTLSS